MSNIEEEIHGSNSEINNLESSRQNEQEESVEKQENQEDSEYKYAKKKNTRPKEEIRHHIEFKRLKEKEDQRAENERKEAENMEKFVKLYKFEENQRNFLSQLASKNSHKNSKISKSSSKISKYEKNEYYVGRKNLDESSFIDVEEYQLAMYEMRKIFGDNTTSNHSLSEKEDRKINSSVNKKNESPYENKDSSTYQRDIPLSSQAKKQHPIVVKQASNSLPPQNNSLYNMPKKPEPNFNKLPNQNNRIAIDHNSDDEKHETPSIIPKRTEDVIEDPITLYPTNKDELLHMIENEKHKHQIKQLSSDREPYSSPDVYEQDIYETDRNNIVVDKDNNEPSMRNSPSKNITQEKVNKILEISRSRDLSQSNLNNSKVRYCITDDGKGNNLSNIMQNHSQINNITESNHNKSNYEEMELHEQEENENEDSQCQLIDLDNLDHESAATILQYYMKNVYLQAIKRKQMEIIQSELNKQDDNNSYRGESKQDSQENNEENEKEEIYDYEKDEIDEDRIKNISNQNFRVKNESNHSIQNIDDNDNINDQFEEKEENDQNDEEEIEVNEPENNEDIEESNRRESKDYDNNFEAPINEEIEQDENNFDEEIGQQDFINEENEDQRHNNLNNQYGENEQDHEYNNDELEQIGVNEEVEKIENDDYNQNIYNNEEINAIEEHDKHFDNNEDNNHEIDIYEHDNKETENNEHDQCSEYNHRSNKSIENEEIEKDDNIQSNSDKEIKENSNSFDEKKEIEDENIIEINDNANNLNDDVSQTLIEEKIREREVSNNEIDQIEEVHENSLIKSQNREITNDEVIVSIENNEDNISKKDNDNFSIENIPTNEDKEDKEYPEEQNISKSFNKEEIQREEDYNISQKQQDEQNEEINMDASIKDNSISLNIDVLESNNALNNKEYTNEEVHIENDILNPDEVDIITKDKPDEEEEDQYNFDQADKIDQVDEQNNYNYSEKDDKEIDINQIEELKEESILQQKVESSNEINKDDEDFADALADEILKNLLQTNLLDNITLFPKKQYKREADLSLSQSRNSGYMLQNNSMISTTSLRTIQEDKKETSNKLYEAKVAPELISILEKEIDKDYKNIINSLSTPYKANPFELTLGLLTNDVDKVLHNYKIVSKPTPNLNKNKILSNFKDTNKQIRETDNILTDNYYDNILNDCLVDASNELLENERYYNGITEPLPWSNRTRQLKFKYNSSDYSKNQFKNKIKSQLNQCLNTKMGMIAENHDIDNELLLKEKEKRLINTITKDILDIEEEWRNYDIEETSIKLELTDLVLDQLFNEIVEILEHVNLSRRNPELYQNKSIYACDDIPKLAFQQTENDVVEGNIDEINNLSHN